MTVFYSEFVAQTLSLPKHSVEAVLQLTEEGATVPFIARYRREKTGNIDEVAIKNILTTHAKKQKLEQLRETVTTALTALGEPAKQAVAAAQHAQSPSELEFIWAPFKNKRQTKAAIARQRGLEPLAQLLYIRRYTIIEAHKEAVRFSTASDISASDALDGALDILTEQCIHKPAVRKAVKKALFHGVLTSKLKRGTTHKDTTYRDYFSFSEPFKRVAPHRLLALVRGEKEGVLSIGIEPSEQIDIIETIEQTFFRFHTDLSYKIAQKAWSSSLKKSVTGELIKEAKEDAWIRSSELFARNLESLLLAPPLGKKPIIAIDPGIRTGCKCVALDEHGTPVGETVLYLHTHPESVRALEQWISLYRPAAIAVGRGTFGRETIAIIRKHCSDNELPSLIPVSEDGASVYSASDIAREELPNMDISFRGAVSIGRRLQDPLSELVKIDPASLGIGQYQHDIPASLLRESLTQCVQWVVNRVGVDINAAEAHLLKYVSGLDMAKARSIVSHRRTHGPFLSREDIKHVKGIGPHAYQMCAGFLLIPEATNILDRTGVHPENYRALKQAAQLLRTDITALLDNPDLLDDDRVQSLSFPDRQSVKEELRRRGRDVRTTTNDQPITFSVSSFEEIREQMTIQGIVDNITAFGAFIDIGLKQKGLLHISEISTDYITDIHKILSLGQQVTVKIIAVDRERKRISLSIKQL